MLKINKVLKKNFGGMINWPIIRFKYFFIVLNKIMELLLSAPIDQSSLLR